MRVLVCGGRNFKLQSFVFETLDALDAEISISFLIEGGAGGADKLARDWAQSRQISFETYFADWKMYGRAAGPIRNATMLRVGRPDLVVAFLGGMGTADMVRQAEASGVRVRHA